MAHYLICYDIANPKRLGKVHRCMLRSTQFVQYSVYYFQGTHAQLTEVLNDIQQLINNTEDDVRAYAVTPLNQAHTLGIPWLPDDIHLH